MRVQLSLDVRLVVGVNSTGRLRL